MDLRALTVILVERGGFEPPKAEPADLQSAPFDHSGTSPGKKIIIQLKRAFTGASEGNRTPDPLITSQLLYHLSYAGHRIYLIKGRNINHSLNRWLFQHQLLRKILYFMVFWLIVKLYLIFIPYFLIRITFSATNSALASRSPR